MMSGPMNGLLKISLGSGIFFFFQAQRGMKDTQGFIELYKEFS